MFFIRMCVITCLVIQACVPLAIFPARADGPTVAINELMWMGSSTSSADEWIELRNLSDQPIDLSSWQLTKKSSGLEVAMLTIPVGKTIPASGLFLISNYAETNPSSSLMVTPDMVDTAVSLSNSAMQIKVYDAAHALIDTADDGVGNPLAGDLDTTAKKFSSMERNPVPGDGMLEQNWHTASRGVGFDVDKAELGTPASVNSNGLPTAAAGPDMSGVAGQAINFDGSDSSDPEEQALTFGWDFGDGQTSSSVTPQHVYTAAGVYSAILAVSDGIDTTSDTVQVTITTAPIAAPTTSTPVTAVDQVGMDNPSCQGLRLSEIFPNPKGVDDGEFVELQNSGDEDISAQRCSVWTSSTRKYTVTDTATIPKNGFMLLPKSLTKLTLNNGGTTVRLVDVDGSELDRVTYGAAQEGMSYAVVSGAWQWTSQPTPGKPNVLKVIATASTTTSKSSSPKKTAGKKSATPAQAVTLRQVQELDSGDRVILRGVITSPLGSLGSTLTTIQSPDGGVTITVPNGTGPIEVGQDVGITGTVRLYQGRRRVAVEAKGLKLIKAHVSVAPLSVATDDVSADQADELVQVHGTVALASGASIEIDDGSGPVTVYLKSSTGIVRPKVKMGDTVDAIGIVGVSTSGVRVLPRSQNDLHVEKVLGAATAPIATTTVPTSSTHQSTWYWAFVALGGLGVAAKPIWRKWREHQD